MRVMGIDMGTKTTGIAVSDEKKIIASSRENITSYQNIHELADRISERIKKLSLETIVIGNPVHMSGRKSDFFDNIQDLGKRLTQLTGIPVVYWDERLSTQAVERTMIEGDLSRKKRKKLINASSAQWILQGYLDYLREKEDNKGKRQI
ncbi:MAG: Holliday junction resolvase RuvX [Candidatus Aureabacteria bacterium]|nr:Holliday junction resolvase RuvX [Candidatus Auribacterota bacterium]